MTEDFSDPDDPFTPVGAGALSLGGGAPPPSAGVPGSGLGAAASLRPVAAVECHFEPSASAKSELARSKPTGVAEAVRPWY